jgi:DNA-binding FadR family transcriptional regulator
MKWTPAGMVNRKGIIAATHNKLIQALARPLVNLRSLREWEAESPMSVDPKETERAYVEVVLQALASRDPDQARQRVRELMELPEQAIETMKETPVGEIPHIESIPLRTR